MTFTDKNNLSRISFFVSSLFFCIIFYLTRHFMTNFDENDHLAVVFFMEKGRLLYKDIFSHHFPLPYYWTYLFTPFWNQDMPSRTLSIFRLSTLVLYLITFTAVNLSYKNPKSRYSLSVFLILLSLVFTLYHGNLVLSETYSAIFIVSLFWLFVPIIIGWEQISLYTLVLSSLIASMSFWNQPLLFFLTFIPLLHTPNKKLKLIILLTIFINLLPVLLFTLNYQLLDFFKQAIWFNFRIYPKYYIDTIPYKDKWWGNIAYFFTNQFSLLTHFKTSHQLFQFISNTSFLLLLIKIIKTNNFKKILTILLIFLSVHVRQNKIIPGTPFNFGIYPLIAVSISAYSIILINYFSTKKIILSILTLILIFVCYQNFRPILTNSLNFDYNYHVFWSPRVQIGQTISSLTEPTDSILIYPHDVDLYYFSNRLSPDRFVYWFPWIDEVDEFRNQRQTALSSTPPKLIYIGNLDFQGQKDYYLKFFPNLTLGYQQLFEQQKPTNIYIRQSLTTPNAIL